MADGLGRPPDSLVELLRAYESQLVGLSLSAAGPMGWTTLLHVGDDFITTGVPETQIRVHTPLHRIWSVQEAPGGFRMKGKPVALLIEFAAVGKPEERLQFAGSLGVEPLV